MAHRWLKKLRWAWVLPVAELLVSMGIAGPLAFVMMRDHPHPFRTINGKLILQMSDPGVKGWLDDGGPRFPSRFQDIAYLNIPAMLIEIGISLPTSWPMSYRPAWARPIGLDGFRALTWPIWALPFWFFAGRGIDSFFRRGRISAFESFFMGLLGVAIAALGTGIVLVGPSENDPQYDAWIAVPAAMWLGFGVICQMAWWYQRRRRKTEALEVRPA